MTNYLPWSFFRQPDLTSPNAQPQRHIIARRPLIFGDPSLTFDCATCYRQCRTVSESYTQTKTHIIKYIRYAQEISISPRT